LIANSDASFLTKVIFPTIWGTKLQTQTNTTSPPWTYRGPLFSSFEVKLTIAQLHLLHLLYCTCIIVLRPWHLPPQRYYQNILIGLVSFLDGQAYHKGTVFPQERLGAITAEDILTSMNFKAFGSTPHPQPDANPAKCCFSSLLFWKKALTFYMPNKHHAWDSLLSRGNPTHSREILDLIKFIKKKEV
jgi:hypothetical protein